MSLIPICFIAGEADGNDNGLYLSYDVYLLSLPKISELSHGRIIIVPKDRGRKDLPELSSSSLGLPQTPGTTREWDLRAEVLGAALPSLFLWCRQPLFHLSLLHRGCWTLAYFSLMDMAHLLVKVLTWTIGISRPSLTKDISGLGPLFIYTLGL